MAALSQPTSGYQFTGSTLQTQKKVLFCKVRKGKKTLSLETQMEV
jgi:hypothetical protein